MEETNNVVRIIKRYKNRKLYDMMESHYVSLNEITELVKSGHDVRVIESDTKNDITAHTLLTAVVIAELERSRTYTPEQTEVLKKIIAGGNSFLNAITPKQEATING